MTATARRLAVLAGILLAAGSLGAVAEAQELEDYLQDSAEAEYSGRQIVVTYWDDETHAGLYEVGQSGGVTMVGGAATGTMVGRGTIDGLEDGRDPQELASWSEWRLAGRYAIEPPSRGERLGRPVTVVTILEEGRARMRVAFDTATGAPLLTEVFDGNGDLYRMAVMVDFAPGAPVMPDRALKGEGDYDLVGTAAPVTLPEQAGGYWRADAYSGPNATIHAFYTDGLFGFSVFEFDGRADAGPFADAAKLDVGGRDYRRISDPGSVLVYWRGSDATYVLVGELPPDHLREVLTDLPGPDSEGLLGRIWRGVFG